MEGEPLNLVVECVGAPVPLMSWQKDGKMLTSSDHCNFRTVGGRSTLHIDKVVPGDGAWYQCTAANTSGVATNRAKLTVQGDLQQVIGF